MPHPKEHGSAELEVEIICLDIKLSYDMKYIYIIFNFDYENVCVYFCNQSVCVHTYYIVVDKCHILFLRG